MENSQFPKNEGKKPILETINPHSERHDDFNNKRLFDRLEAKHKPKPYWKQYRILYLAVLGASFLFHVLSACTAAALIYFFLFGLTGSVTASGALTLAALAVLEFTKRETSAKFFHTRLQFGKMSSGLFAAVLGLSVISTAASYFGAEKTVHQFAKGPALMNADSSTMPLKVQIADLDKQIGDAKKMKWKGKLTVQGQNTLASLTAAKADLLTEQNRQQKRIDSKNDTAETEHKTTTNTNAGQFAAFTLLSEILLIFCLFYIQYYDFRSFAEYAHAHAEEQPEPAAEPMTAKPAAPNVRQNAPPAFQHNGNSLPTNERQPIGFAYANRNAPAYAPARTQNVDTQNVITQTVAEQTRVCEHCGTAYVYGHRRQKFCTDQCRIDAWQNRTGRKIKRTGAAPIG
ncbi:MAG: hypothetical protein WCR52_11495 [Bacteroidota bacterium]|uniref:hypothetical protein n=1 Tax=Runella sp. TaxID=1960881 RepID=UPI00301AE82B